MHQNHVLHPSQTHCSNGSGPNQGTKAADSGPRRRIAGRGFAATVVDVPPTPAAFNLTNRGGRDDLMTEFSSRGPALLVSRPDPMFLPRGVQTWAARNSGRPFHRPPDIKL